MQLDFKRQTTTRKLKACTVFRILRGERARMDIELLKRSIKLIVGQGMKEIVKKVKLLKPFDVDKITVKIDRYFPNLT